MHSWSGRSRPPASPRTATRPSSPSTPRPSLCLKRAPTRSWSSVTDSGGATPITVVGRLARRHRRRPADRRRRRRLLTATPASQLAGIGRRHLHRRQPTAPRPPTSPAPSTGATARRTASARRRHGGARRLRRRGQPHLRQARRLHHHDHRHRRRRLDGHPHRHGHRHRPRRSPARPTSFTAVEGQNTGLFVLATFTDPNTLATVADVNAELAVGGWGDGTPTTAGVTLVVQQIGVTPLTSDRSGRADLRGPRQPHLRRGNARGPARHPQRHHHDLGRRDHHADQPARRRRHRPRRPLTSSNGTEITGIEGITTGTVLLGTFTDANQGATVADFTTGGGSVVVNWGDGSAPQTLTAANLTAVGSPERRDLHRQRRRTPTPKRGPTPTPSRSPTTAARSPSSPARPSSPTRPLHPRRPSRPSAPIEAVDLPGSGVLAAAVQRPGRLVHRRQPHRAPLSDFTATIDWGDGTPMTAGTVSQPGGLGTAFIVSGSHTYAASGVTTGTGTSGTYPIQVFVIDVGGSRLTVDNTATVADIPIAAHRHTQSGDRQRPVDRHRRRHQRQPARLLRHLRSRSRHVTLFGHPASERHAASSSARSRPAATARGTSSPTCPLADGHYSITATAIDQFGETTVTVPPARS